MTTLQHTDQARLSLGKRGAFEASPAGHGWPAEWAPTTPEPHPPTNPAATQSVGLKTASALSKAQIHHNPAQIVTDGWIADFPSASQWITQQLSCAAWNPPERLNNHAEFCDPIADRWAARATRMQLTDPVAASHLWARADRRITNLAPWIPTVTESETDLLSRRVGDYQIVPTIGALVDQLWVR